jgi:hypothetical protein
MTALDTALLIHLLGFLTGGALYALLAVMVVRSAGAAAHPAESLAGNRLALATAVLGLVWNAGALLVYGQRDFGGGPASPWVAAPAFAALGFLPAVVVHAALRDRHSWAAHGYVITAYTLSGAAAALQVADAGHGHALPSRTALLLLTAGFVVLTAGLALQHRRLGGRRPLSAVGLAVFAVSALHLGGHHAEAGESPIMALVGHHASLPLALVILYQDYRFALADVFLKRALALVALVAVTTSAYLWVAIPLLGEHRQVSPSISHPPVDGVLLALWVGTALLYPTLRRATGLLVDRLLLRRPDYPHLRTEIADALEQAASEEAVLDAASGALHGALGATVHWRSVETRAPATHALLDATATGQARVTLSVPTTDSPAFALEIAAPEGGRRLLSDDVALLESVALLAARRVDALRVARERYRRDLREAEIHRLASEAELSALRAQLNPHFLFNTLNTLGYLMDVAPERGHRTLHRVSELLRAVLYRSQREWSTLGEEVELVEAYLEIERARFDERLCVVVDVPAALRTLPVPPLLLQPLVENAMKHGIAPYRAGGTVTVAATLATGDTDVRNSCLHVSVTDTGSGARVAGSGLAHAGRGLGLANLERRLAHAYGDHASLRLRAADGGGTCVDLRLPLRHDIQPQRAGTNGQGAHGREDAPRRPDAPSLADTAVLPAGSR